MVILLRFLIDDVTNPLKYSDDRLSQLLLVGAKLVVADIAFSQSYTVSISDLILSPDPTESATRDDSFVNLVALKSACILDNTIARTAAGKAVLVKEGPTMFDKRTIAKSLLDILSKGYCALYEEAKYQYQAGSGVAGSAIMTPFRMAYTGYAGGNYSDWRFR